jgi:cellulose synthase (UDP-forming)
MVIVAEVILIANALLSMWTILSDRGDPRDFAFHDAEIAPFRRRSRPG